MICQYHNISTTYNHRGASRQKALLTWMLANGTTEIGHKPFIRALRKLGNHLRKGYRSIGGKITFAKGQSKGRSAILE
jgi:hypothetical protein